MKSKLKKFVMRFTLTELLMTIVILVTLLALGMRSVRELRSASLARMGTTEMKSAVQKAYQFALFNEIPSIIKITKEDVGFAKGAIQSTQGYAMNGYFTLDNGVVDAGATPGYFENNSRERTGRLQGSLGALSSASAFTSGLTGGGLDLAYDDDGAGSNSDDAIQTSFNLSPTSGPAHIDMWIYNIDKEDTDPANSGVGHGTIFKVQNFEGRVEGGRLNFFSTKTESVQTEPIDPDIGDSYIIAQSKVWKFWWTNVDPSVAQWNKLGVTFLPSGFVATWNGLPLEFEEETRIIDQGEKRRFEGWDSTASSNVWVDFEFDTNPGYPNTNNPLIFPRLSVSSAGNNLEAGVVDNIGTYDLATGPAVMSDPKAGHYFVMNEDYEEVDDLTISLNERGEVISPDYAFLQYIPLNQENDSYTCSVRGRMTHDYHTVDDGGQMVFYDLTFDPPNLDQSLVPRSGWLIMKCDFPGACDGNPHRTFRPSDPWQGARSTGEWITYENLRFVGATIEIDVLKRQADYEITHEGSPGHRNHGSRRYRPEISFPYVFPGAVKNYVEFRRGSKPQW